MIEEIASGIESLHLEARSAKPAAECSQQRYVVVHQKNDGLFRSAGWIQII